MNFLVDISIDIIKLSFIIAWWTFKQIIKIPIGIFKCWNYGNTVDIFTFIVYMIVLIVNINISKTIDYIDFTIFLTGLIMIIRFNSLSELNVKMNEPNWMKNILLKLNRDNENIKNEIKKQPKKLNQRVIIEDVPEKPTKPDEEVLKYFKPKQPQIIEVTDYKILEG